jgi:hypothetical protein
MKTKIQFTLVMVIIVVNGLTAQKRIQPPKNRTNIPSVDKFVDASFGIYDKIFVYDSILRMDGEVLDEYNNLEDIEYDMDSIIDVIPDILEELEEQSMLKKAKALLNFNKAKKALKYSSKRFKEMLIGTKKDEF